MKSMRLIFEDAIQKKSFLFQNPVERLYARTLDEVPAAFAKMEEYRMQGFYLAGFVAYEAGFAFFPSFEGPMRFSAQPLIDFGVFREKQIFEGTEPDETPSVVISDVSFDTTQEEYLSQQKTIQKNLWAGEIYQLNQTFQMSFRANLSAQNLYTNLKKNQSTSYSAFLQFDDYEVLSLSPELFYQKQGSQIKTQPMKGTLALGQDTKLLTEDEKNVAENLMIVDLLRNDLGKIAKPGSVRVEQLFHVQQLATVQQMTSTICADVETDLPIGTIFSSLFPCGSITGAPKWSAMQKIAKLESSPRGVYTGAIGFVEPNNDQCFNVAIRTIVTQDKKHSMGLGGGIVVDSKGDQEYKEAHLKSRFLRQCNHHFFLFETILFDGARLVHLEEHLHRLQSSALFYNFEINASEIGRQLNEFQQTCKEPQIIKLQLFWDGQIKISARQRLAPPTEPRVAVSLRRINSQNHFQFHKTSSRALYDQEWERVQKQNIYDVLFLNERDELVEASRHNLFLKVDNQWWTPPLSSGVLPGIERGLLLKKGFAKERVLLMSDLKSAQDVLLTNSVRGQVSVQVELS